MQLPHAGTVQRDLTCQVVVHRATDSRVKVPQVLTATFDAHLQVAVAMELIQCFKDP